MNDRKNSAKPLSYPSQNKKRNKANTQADPICFTFYFAHRTKAHPPPDSIEGENCINIADNETKTHHFNNYL
jgi:hypothetical protein